VALGLCVPAVDAHFGPLLYFFALFVPFPVHYAVCFLLLFWCLAVFPSGCIPTCTPVARYVRRRHCGAAPSCGV
jgi:hypothetical protein